MKAQAMLFQYVMCVTLIISAVACGNSDRAAAEYQETWDENPPAALGKPDLLADLATPMTLGQSVSGRINKAGNQGDRQVYLLQLQVGDRVRLVMEGKSTLSPDFVVYRGAGEKIHSQSWDVTDQTLTKEYVTDGAGRFAVLVRAYQGQGSGDYTLLATCLGGPCNGEFPDPAAMEVKDAAECIDTARSCAFMEIAGSSAAVTLSEAGTLFDDCLAQFSFDGGYSCHRACEFVDVNDTYYPNGAAELCKEVKAALVFYSEKSAACVELLDDCLTTCDDFGNDWDHDFVWSAAYACFTGGFNGNCNSYARDHEFCGGTDYLDNTWDQCCAFVQSTDGVWTDDMDTMCADACGEYHDDPE